MKQKLRVGILCGGISREHEVSLASAQNVLSALDPEKYEAAAIFIDKTGKWHVIETKRLCQRNAFELLTEGIASSTEHSIISYSQPTIAANSLDVVFPVLHGPYGEDGTVQGFLKLMQIPFVGASVLGSAVGMDKDVMKRLLHAAGLPVVRFCTLKAHQKNSLDYRAICEEFGMPLFIKPANLGSSLGVSKVKSEQELPEAIEKAFLYDRKILIEECIEGRELECGILECLILDGESVTASEVGEVITAHEFYSYEAKYLDEELRLEIPATISPTQKQMVQELAVRAFETLCCEGMARVDFFMKEDGELFVNEVNTIPGFTNSSMYPKLWEASGISYNELVDRLIQLAILRHEQEMGINKNALTVC